MPLQEILTASIAPVALISGIGLVLLSMTNRYGRVIDRARDIAHALRHGGQPPHGARTQLHILTERAHLLRSGISWSVVSVMFVGILISLLFAQNFLSIELPDLIPAGSFLIAIVSFLISLTFLLRDLARSLEALHLEVKDLPSKPAA